MDQLQLRVPGINIWWGGEPWDPPLRNLPSSIVECDKKRSSFVWPVLEVIKFKNPVLIPGTKGLFGGWISPYWYVHIEASAHATTVHVPADITLWALLWLSRVSEKDNRILYVIVKCNLILTEMSPYADMHMHIYMYISLVPRLREEGKKQPGTNCMRMC